MIPADGSLRPSTPIEAFKIFVGFMVVDPKELFYLHELRMLRRQALTLAKPGVRTTIRLNVFAIREATPPLRNSHNAFYRLFQVPD